MKKIVNLFCKNFSAPQHRSTAAPQHRSTAAPQHRSTAAILLLLINFLTIFSASAQDNFPKLRTKLDRVFTRVDKNQIPYGILEENSFGFMNLWQVK